MNPDEELAALHRRDTEPAHRAACPPTTELVSLAAGEAAPADRDRLVDHIAGCTACAEEVRLMRSLRPWAEKVAKKVEGEGEERRRARFLLPLAAALLIAVIGAGLLLRRDVAAPPDSTVLRGALAERVSPAPDAVLQESPGELAWPPQPGATGYRVKLYDEAANLLWESPPFRQPRQALPPEIGARLRSGASYFWTIDIEGPVRQNRLGPYWFRLV